MGKGRGYSVSAVYSMDRNGPLVRLGLHETEALIDPYTSAPTISSIFHARNEADLVYTLEDNFRINQAIGTDAADLGALLMRLQPPPTDPHVALMRKKLFAGALQAGEQSLAQEIGSITWTVLAFTTPLGFVDMALDVYDWMNEDSSAVS